MRHVGATDQQELHHCLSSPSCSGAARTRNRYPTPSGMLIKAVLLAGASEVAGVQGLKCLLGVSWAFLKCLLGVSWAFEVSPGHLLGVWSVFWASPGCLECLLGVSWAFEVSPGRLQHPRWAALSSLPPRPLTLGSLLAQLQKELNTTPALLTPDLPSHPPPFRQCVADPGPF